MPVSLNPNVPPIAKLLVFDDVSALTLNAKLVPVAAPNVGVTNTGLVANAIPPDPVTF